MTRENQIAIGGALLVALGAGVYFQQQKDQAIGKTATHSAEIPEVKVTDEVDKFSIVNADKGEVVLEKRATSG
jgi:hypothetical protein